MTHTVRAVAPRTPLREVARILVEEGISGVPVVTDDGHVLGVVSETDILVKERGARHTRLDLLDGVSEWNDIELAAKLRARTAGEAMTQPAVTISAESPLSKAAALMVDCGVGRLPVVDPGGKLVGIVTATDLVRQFARPDAEIEVEIRREIVYGEFSLAPGAISVAVADGQVTLEGAIASRSLADELVAAIKRVFGVVSVWSKLTYPSEPVGSP